MATHEDFSRIHAVKTSSHRSFGWVFTGAFALLGVWPALSGGAVRWWSMIVAGRVPRPSRSSRPRCSAR